ncbi:MAG TPA: DciA family protein [Terriglobales bacterium]|nr:DciA family protein [Terriglobales bacterium]
MVKVGPLDSFGTILSGLAKRLGLESRLHELRLQHHWRELIGEPIASHTWPEQIRFKKLYLTVPNSVWLQQLTFLKPTLLAKLNAADGADLVTDIVLRVGELPSTDRPSASTPESTDQPRVSSAAWAEASDHAAAIQNPELRTRLTEVMAEALDRSEHP